MGCPLALGRHLLCKHSGMAGGASCTARASPRHLSTVAATEIRRCRKRSVPRGPRARRIQLAFINRIIALIETTAILYKADRGTIVTAFNYRHERIAFGTGNRIGLGDPTRQDARHIHKLQFKRTGLPPLS